MGQVPSEPFLLPLAVQPPPLWVHYLSLRKDSSQGGHSLAGDPGWPVLGLVPVGWMGWGVYEHRPMKMEQGPWLGTACGGLDSVGLTSYTWKKRVEVSIGGEKQNKARLNHTSSSELPGAGKGCPAEVSALHTIRACVRRRDTWGNTQGSRHAGPGLGNSTRSWRSPR